MAKVLVIGSGGREHALAWALSRSQHVSQVYVAPGNGGTDWPQSGGLGMHPGAPCESVDLQATDFEKLIDFAKQNQIELTVIGPEVPLAAGIVDQFDAACLPVFGPSGAAAQLEASKVFAKDFMTEKGIPTAGYFVTDDAFEARKFLNERSGPVVVKADGLAAGKGVYVCENREQAGEAIHDLMVRRIYGDAGERVVIEECLRGREISVLAFADGHIVKPMLIARDYKRAHDGDAGPNTGGMGAIAPVQEISSDELNWIVSAVLQPVLDGMNALGTPYRGVLYAGLMLTDQGPRVLEYNCRFGDPETQVILPLLETDFYDILKACIDGRLNNLDLNWIEDASATIVLAAPGYPGEYPRDLPISGLEQLAMFNHTIAFHAGTRTQGQDIVTHGGRVLNITSVGADVEQALERSYAAIRAVQFDGMQYRRDIGH